MSRIALCLAGVAACIAAGASAAQTVYRCQSADGVVYTDKPCTADAPSAQLPALNLHSAQRYRESGSTPAERPRRDTKHAKPEREPARPRCPDAGAIERAVRAHRVVRCMTPAQVRRATPHGLSGHEVRTSVDATGPFTEWQYPVIRAGWPVRIQFRAGQVFGYETLPFHARE